MRVLGWVLAGCALLAAALFVWMLAAAQNACPWLACKGPDGDAWMPVLLVAPLGVPALMVFLLFAAKALWPNSPKVARAGRWLKYAFFAIASLAVLSPFMLGYLRGLEQTSHPATPSQ